MKNLMRCAVGAASLLAGVAAAQDPDNRTQPAPDPDYRIQPAPDPYYRNEPVPAPPAYPASRSQSPRPKNEALLTRRFGMQMEIGGGAQQFLDRQASSVTDVGGNWSARLVLGTRMHLGVEGAYVGTAQAIEALGLANNAILMSNGVEGLLRVNVLTGAWQPYAAAGYTWRHYRIANSAVNTSSVADSANVNEIPVAVGLAFRPRPFVADLRATLHNAFGTPLLPDANLTSIGGELKVGFEF